MMVVTPISTISTVLTTYIYSLHSIYLLYPFILKSRYNTPYLSIQRCLPHSSHVFSSCQAEPQIVTSHPFFADANINFNFNFTSTDSVSSNIFSSISLLRCVVMAVLTTGQFLLSQCSMCDKKYEQSRSNLLSAIDRGGPYQPP